MEFALSCREPASYQEKADFLFIEWRDRKGIMNLGHKYINKKFILFLPDASEIDEKELNDYNKFCHNNLYCRVFSTKHLELCQKYKIKYYFGMPATSFYQIMSAKEQGASFVHITSPLTQSLKKVKQLGLPIMVTLNAAYDLYPFQKQNPCGNWFRPEDIDFYKDYIDIGCFLYNDLKQERAFYRVYAETHKWVGNLQDLIIGLNYPGKNDMLSSVITQTRLNCEQKCQAGSGCRMCWRALDLADPTLLKSIKQKKNNIDIFKKV